MCNFHECLLVLCFWLLWAVQTVMWSVISDVQATWAFGPFGPCWPNGCIVAVQVFHPLYVQHSPVFWCWQILPIFFFLLAFLWQAECWVWWCTMVKSQKSKVAIPTSSQNTRGASSNNRRNPLHLVWFLPNCLLVKCRSLASWCLVNALLVLLIRGCRWLPLSGREYALAERNECFFRGAFHAINVAWNQDTQVQCCLKL